MRRVSEVLLAMPTRSTTSLLHPKSFTISLAMAVVSDLTPNIESARVAKSNGDSLDLPPLDTPGCQ